MNKILSEYFIKLFTKQWTIGLSRCLISDIINSKNFNPDITWFPLKSFDEFYADPFLNKTKEGDFDIFFEDFSISEKYGKISVLRVDENFKQVRENILLDTKDHFSYPFVFNEKNKTYVFPEARISGKLSCYEYDPVQMSLSFLQDILDLPLLDSSILKYNDKYWIFGALGEQETFYKLNIFSSKSLFGPYTSHPENPMKNGLNGIRPAGNFIEVDGILYRPTQNCENYYGESITINKINELNEFSFKEEPYMLIVLNGKNKHNYGMHNIHTINVVDDLLAVDGEKWTFSPLDQLKSFIRKRLNNCWKSEKKTC